MINPWRHYLDESGGLWINDRCLVGYDLNSRNGDCAFEYSDDNGDHWWYGTLYEFVMEMTNKYAEYFAGNFDSDPDTKYASTGFKKGDIVTFCCDHPEGIDDLYVRGSVGVVTDSSEDPEEYRVAIPGISRTYWYRGYDLRSATPDEVSDAFLKLTVKMEGEEK